MRFNYLLYPAALEKLRTSGIEARVQELKESGGLPYLGGHVFARDIFYTVKNLEENGFYRYLPKDFASGYKKTMENILARPHDFFWSVERQGGKISEPCDLEDLLLFSGDFASLVLRPQEIWDHAGFGFSSPTEFVATVSAFVRQESIGHSFREGYKWTTKRTDGSEVMTEVTGDGDSDLRIFQTDIAPYPTIDPFGNLIEMRPEMDTDKHTIAAYHSTE
ncbi:MAG: hypothetical protein ABIA37_05040, partial [Candidatus Woesearchaeota archaeon]